MLAVDEGHICIISSTDIEDAYLLIKPAVHNKSSIKFVPKRRAFNFRSLISIFVCIYLNARLNTKSVTLMK